jgi:hypothetical protein
MSLVVEVSLWRVAKSPAIIWRMLASSSTINILRLMSFSSGDLRNE